MILVVCVDDSMGMMFNKRRQSKDAVVRQNMLALLPEGGKLYVSPYTAKQFLPEEQERLFVSERFLSEAGAEEFCFAEDADLSLIESQVDGLVLYRWNRIYPSDVKFEMNLGDFELVSTEEFVGNSHPEMVREIYKRK